MDSKKIVISGYYGFQNTGDEAMLTAIIDNLKAINSAIELTVISGNPKETQRQFGVTSISRLHVAKIIMALRRCDMLISGGGSLLQDVTSKRSLYYYLSIMRLAKYLNKKVFLYAQGIGPLLQKRARHTVGHTLQMVDFITVRDESSKALLQNLGIADDRIKVTADAVLSMPRPSAAIGLQKLREIGVDISKPLLVVAMRDWQDDQSGKQHVAHVLDRCIEDGTQVLFLAMQFHADQKTNQTIQQYMTWSEKTFSFSSPLSVQEIMSVIGHAQAVLGMRLHALIFSALMKVPMIGISYDPKIDSFLESIGQRAVGSISSVDEADLYAKIQPLLSGKMNWDWSIVEYLQQRARETALLANQLLVKEHTHETTN